jgi:short-chain fatty acids transporter
LKNSNFSNRFITVVRGVLPSPFTIAIFLSVITVFAALFFTKPEQESTSAYFFELLTWWEAGLWDSSTGGLYFAFQMMLMLVLGHCLALTPPFEKLIRQVLKYCTNSAKSAAIVAVIAIVLGLFNWGLGLVVSAILARKIGEKFSANKQPINYGLVGAAAYLGMMVWHGGLSGSAPTKIMEQGYLQELMMGFAHVNTPERIPLAATIGSNMNIFSILLLLIILPTAVYWMGKKWKNEHLLQLEQYKPKNEELHQSNTFLLAERLDHSSWLGKSVGIFLLLVCTITAFKYEGSDFFGFIQPNFINLFLFALCLLFHRSILTFLNAVQTAIGDIAGILIQFPLYFGILGILKESGLIIMFSNYMVDWANSDTLPFFTFISAGVVNFFVPSGGGQWAIQGPLIIHVANEINADLPKSIMAMAYGDQLTNMLQPFWALPLLGITKLKAHQILPYTFIFFLLGAIIFSLVIALF